MNRGYLKLNQLKEVAKDKKGKDREERSSSREQRINSNLFNIQIKPFD
jgi:hypothetical protein